MSLNAASAFCVYCNHWLLMLHPVSLEPIQVSSYTLLLSFLFVELTITLTN
jgi:hypothetical protein